MKVKLSLPEGFNIFTKASNIKSSVVAGKRPINIVISVLGILCISFAAVYFATTTFHLHHVDIICKTSIGLLGITGAMLTAFSVYKLMTGVKGEKKEGFELLDVLEEGEFEKNDAKRISEMLLNKLIDDKNLAAFIKNNIFPKDILRLTLQKDNKRNLIHAQIQAKSSRSGKIRDDAWFVVAGAKLFASDKINFSIDVKNKKLIFKKDSISMKNDVEIKIKNSIRKMPIEADLEFLQMNDGYINLKVNLKKCGSGFMGAIAKKMIKSTRGDRTYYSYDEFKHDFEKIFE